MLGTTIPGGWTKTKSMQISTQVEVVVEVRVELGNGLKALTSHICYHSKRYQAKL